MQWQWINWCSQYKWSLIIIIKQLVSEHSKVSQNYFRCCQNIKWSIPSTLPSVCVDQQRKIQLCPVSSELQPAAMCFYLPGSVSHCTRTKCLDKAGYHSDTAEARNAVPTSSGSQEPQKLWEYCVRWWSDFFQDYSFKVTINLSLPNYLSSGKHHSDIVSWCICILMW